MITSLLNFLDFLDFLSFLTCPLDEMKRWTNSSLPRSCTHAIERLCWLAFAWWWAVTSTGITGNSHKKPSCRELITDQGLHHHHPSYHCGCCCCCTSHAVLRTLISPFFSCFFLSFLEPFFSLSSFKSSTTTTKIFFFLFLYYFYNNHFFPFGSFVFHLQGPLLTLFSKYTTLVVVKSHQTFLHYFTCT